MERISATVASLAQAQQLLDVGVDDLYLGEDYFGLRLPHSFERTQLTQVVQLAHAAHKTVTVAVNAIFHNDRIAHVLDYLEFLASLKVDLITVGDPGAINLLLENQVDLKYAWDGEVQVTNSRQINFWARHQASAAVLSREVPYEELEELAPALKVPAEVLVFGPTAIHQSARPLITNYFNFVKEHQERSDRQRGLFLSAPHHPETHYSIYQDKNGTHIFASNDINLLARLPKLHDLGLTWWKLDGLFFTNETDFVAIAEAFVQARQALIAGNWDEAFVAQLEQVITDHKPQNRQMDTGFFDYDRDKVK